MITRKQAELKAMTSTQKTHQSLVADTIRNAGMPAVVKGDRILCQLKNRKCYATEVALVLENLLDENLVSLFQIDSGVAVCVN